MDIGGSPSAPSAILGRSVADRGVFVWSVLIVTMVSLVLAGCLQTRRQVCHRQAPLDKRLLPAVSRATRHQCLRYNRITVTRCLTRNSRSLTCFAAQPKRKPRVKPRLCHIRLAPTHLPASLTHQLRASNPMAHPRHLRPPPPRRPPIRIPRTHCRIPNNR